MRKHLHSSVVAYAAAALVAVALTTFAPRAAAQSQLRGTLTAVPHCKDGVLVALTLELPVPLSGNLTIGIPQGACTALPDTPTPQELSPSRPPTRKPAGSRAA
jgi:hypothetical protein